MLGQGRPDWDKAVLMATCEEGIVCGEGPSAHLDTDRIDCKERLSSAWGAFITA